MGMFQPPGICGTNPTMAHARIVELRGYGLSIAEIAAASELAPNTLRRYCAGALVTTPARRRVDRQLDLAITAKAALTASIERLATRYGRYGYRRIRRMLVDEGWRVNVKRVDRIWRREVLKVPSKQPKRGRLWLNDGSCVRLRPERPNHVWSYDFVQDRTEDGRTFRMLCVIDEFTRRCLTILVTRRLRSDDVLQCLTDLFVKHRPPEHIRSDNRPEFAARAARHWLGRLSVNPHDCIKKRSEKAEGAGPPL